MAEPYTTLEPDDRPMLEFWLLRLHDEKLSWHSYKDEETREKWAAKYRARGDRVSFDGYIRG